MGRYENLVDRFDICRRVFLFGIVRKYIVERNDFSKYVVYWYL